MTASSTRAQRRYSSGRRADHDQGRVVLPSIHLKRLFRKAPVPDPKKLSNMKIMTRCLDVPNFLADGLDLLVDEGLLEETDEDGDVQDKTFEAIDELLEASDNLVQQLTDHATLTVDDNSFEWLEDFNARAGTDDDKIEWLSAVTLEQMTEENGNLCQPCQGCPDRPTSQTYVQSAYRSNRLAAYISETRSS